MFFILLNNTREHISKKFRYPCFAENVSGNIFVYIIYNHITSLF